MTKVIVRISICGGYSRDIGETHNSMVDSTLQLDAMLAEAIVDTINKVCSPHDLEIPLVLAKAIKIFAIEANEDKALSSLKQAAADYIRAHERAES